MQLTAGNSCKKSGQNYLKSSYSRLVERMLRISEAVMVAKVGHFDEGQV